MKDKKVSTLLFKQKKMTKSNQLKKNYNIKDIYSFYVNIINERFNENSEDLIFQVHDSFDISNEIMMNNNYIKDYMELVSDAINNGVQYIPFIIPLNISFIDSKNLKNGESACNKIQYYLSTLYRKSLNSDSIIMERVKYINGKNGIFSDLNFNTESLNNLLESNDSSSVKRNSKRILIKDPVDNSNITDIKDFSRDRSSNSIISDRNIDYFINKYYKGNYILAIKIDLNRVPSDFNDAINSMKRCYTKHKEFIKNQSEINNIVFKNNSDYHKALNEYNAYSSKLKSILEKFDDSIVKLNNITKSGTECRQEENAYNELMNIKLVLNSYFNGKYKKANKLESRIEDFSGEYYDTEYSDGSSVDFPDTDSIPVDPNQSFGFRVSRQEQNLSIESFEF